MFYKKKIIMLDRSNKVFSAVELTQTGNDIVLQAKESYDIAIYYAREMISCGVTNSFTLKNYLGGEIHIAIMSNDSVIATGSTEGNHFPHLFTRDNQKTYDKGVLAHSRINNQKEKDTTFKDKKTEDISSPNVQDIENDKKVEVIKNDSPMQENAEKTDNTNLDILENIQKSTQKEHTVCEFYCSIKSHLDEMLTCYPRENTLTELIDESEWVKVERDDGYYAVGLIKNNNEPEYLCYGVPGKECDTPPDHLKSYCAFIPTSDNGDGYWTVFQDAKTGIAIKNE